MFSEFYPVNGYIKFSEFYPVSDTQKECGLHTYFLWAINKAQVGDFILRSAQVVEPTSKFVVVGAQAPSQFQLQISRDQCDFWSEKRVLNEIPSWV